MQLIHRTLLTTTFLLSVLLSSCSTMPANVDKPNHRTPKQGASVLVLKNNSSIGNVDALNKFRDTLKGSSVSYSSQDKAHIWDLNGGILDGKNQKGDGGQSENQEPLIRCSMPLIIKDGFVRNNKNGLQFSDKNSGVNRITWLNVGEDAVVTLGNDAVRFQIIDCEFMNNRNGDKSIQLNNASDALIKDNLIYSGRTGARIFSQKANKSGDKATAINNRFVGTDTAWNIQVGTLKLKDNKYDSVRLEAKTEHGGRTSED